MTLFRFGIRQKLAIVFFLFFLIFTGTVTIVLVNVQQMMTTTEAIVTKNKQLDELIDAMLTSLLAMETNHKKLILLKKERYRDHFRKAKEDFESALAETLKLTGTAQKRYSPWGDFAYSYERHRSGVWDNNDATMGDEWVTDQVLAIWLKTINEGKIHNEHEIDETLNDLSENSKVNLRNGMIGFCLSIVAGFLGIFFINSSILSPLKKLAKALKRIPMEKHHQPITLKGGDEFREIASAYNTMSQQLNEEENIRNEFIATLSHEIRTPLSSIRESVNLMAEEWYGPINEKQRKFLTIADIEIQRINTLLNYLLNVSVLEDNDRKRNSVALNTLEMVRSSTESFAAMAEKKKVRINILPGDTKNELYGAPEELQQVFINIIGNAVKYSPEKGFVTITWNRERSRNFVLFRVKDCGPGIAEDELSLVFTKYYRTKKVRGHLDGVGLGLAIARKIIISYGGEINVANNKGPGCTFVFSLPTKP
jgi:signal transduction histidine kinase